MKIKDLDNIKNKETCFIPYEQKTKNAYFVYLTISIVLFLSVFIFSLFAAINVSKYKLYNVKLTDFNYPILNLFYAPIVCLIAIILSMILLIFAPRVSIVSSKYSSRMFYTAFWLLLIGVMLSSEVQLTYISQSGILYNENYHWINPIIARIFIIFSLFLILITQLFFWIMRRKFTFMNSDYEIYTTRSSMEKKQRRIRKQELKKIKKQEKGFSKKTLNIK